MMQSSQGTLDFKSVDKITFVGASSNTVIDTTTGSVGVGVDANGPTSNLHVVGNAYVSTDLTVTGDINFFGTFNQNGAPFASSPWTTTGSDLSYTTGNVAVTGTGSLTVPSGSTGQRPANPVSGMVRFNSTVYQYEAWGMANWLPLSIIDPPPLFNFTSFKFTNAGKTGRDGPSLNEIRAHADYDTNANSHGYPPPSWDMTDSSLFNLGVENNGGVSRNGFQLWTVPADGNYTIQAQGAMGGDAPVSPAASPGKGARVQADFALTQGTKINILVGQGGMATTITTGYPHPSPGASNGGGGATWVLKQNFTTSTNDIYLIAGGGTGTSEYGNYSTTAAHGNGDTQGTSSAGGAQSPNGSSGGAGWGADGNPTSHNTRGRRPHVGAQGGLLNQPTLGEGGFGGGGAGQDHSPGGGGGYGGAGGAYYSNMGGYGSASSWIMTTVNNRSFLGNPYNGAAGEAGWVIITKL